MFNKLKIENDIFISFINIKKCLVFLEFKNGHKNKIENFFSKEEMKKINSFKFHKKQTEWLTGKFCIKKLFSCSYLKNIDFKDISILSKNSKAPYIKEFPELSISISHSFNFAASALSLNKNRKIGIDIENLKAERDWNLIKKIAFSDDEISCFEKKLKKKDNEISCFEKKIKKKKDEYIFYKNWTIKEAFLKYLEKGFAEPLKNIEVFENKIYYKKKEHKNIKIVSNITKENYIFSVVFEK